MSAPCVPATTGEAVPKVCRVDDVLRHLRMSRRTFERLMARHALPLVELERFGRVRRFTGESLERVLRGRWAHKGAA